MDRIFVYEKHLSPGGCLPLPRGYLRNEFHFSGVHGAMNRSGSRAK